MNVLDKSQPIYDRIEQLREQLRKRDKNVSICVDGSGQKTEINWFEEYTWGVLDDFNTIKLPHDNF